MLCVCIVCGKEKDHKARGMCNTCYRRAERSEKSTTLRAQMFLKNYGKELTKLVKIRDLASGAALLLPEEIQAIGTIITKRIAEEEANRQEPAKLTVVK